MVVLVDMDGVLANFVEGFQKLWKGKGYPGLDEWTHWDMARHIPVFYHHRIHPVMCEPGLFRDLEVMPGAQDAIYELQENGITVRVCSTPVAGSVHCASEKLAWLDEHFGPTLAKTAILTGDKTYVKGDLLIDDKPLIEGDFTPEWEHVIFDQPYNRHVSSKRRMTHWDHWRECLKRVG